MEKKAFESSPFFLLLSVLVLSLAVPPPSVLAQTPPEKEFTALADRFLSSIRSNTVGRPAKNPSEKDKDRILGLKELLNTDIVLAPMTKTEISLLGQKMLNNEISIPEFIRKITGHNISQFLQSQWVLRAYKIEPAVKTDTIKTPKGGQDQVTYYIKAEVEVRMEPGQVRKKRCELDFNQDSSGRWKIAGFIL